MAKRWVYAAVAAPVVLVAAVLVAASAFDPNSQKDRIVDAVRRATGRELTLGGPIRLGWSLTPTLEAEDVAFANMPGGTRPAMATAARMEAGVKLWPLLFHRVELARVTLVRPDILIETDAAGRGNWQFDRPASSGSGEAATPGVHTRTVLDSLRIEAGRVTWHDGVTGRTVAADVPHATVDGGDGPLHVQAELELAGTAGTLDATLGTVPQLTGRAPGPWPVTLAAALGGASLALKGVADPAERTLSGHLEAAVPDVARLGALLQYPAWPPLHDLHIAATLPPGGGLPQDVSVQLGAADLSQWAPGASLGKLALTWPAGQPARLEAEGSLAGAPWHIASGLVQAGSGVALRGLAVTSALGDLAGDVAVQTAPRLTVRGTLVSNRIDVAAFSAIPHAGEAAPAGPAAPAPQPAPASPDRVFSEQPLPWGVLRRADADLQLSIATVHAGKADYRDFSGHVLLQDGVLRVNPASFQSPEGRVAFSASVDARQPAPLVALALRSDAFALDPLAQAFGLPGGSHATAELDVALHAAGATPHALAASLDGHVGVALVDGEVSNAALAAALGDVLRKAGAGLEPDGSSHVRCLALRADAQSGVVTLAALKLDSARLLLQGGGTINLADETMALRLRPLLRLGGAGVSAPIRVDGTLRHPVVTLDAAGPGGRVGVVIGGLAGPAESCTAELTAARDGRIGQLPTEVAAATKGPKPADLLRSLLR